VNPYCGAAAKAALEGASKIVIWAGGGAVNSSESISALASHWNAPVLTSFAGRGIAADSAHTLVAPIHEPETEAVLADADALVVFGSQLDGMNTKNWAIAWLLLNWSAQLQSFLNSLFSLRSIAGPQ
jgi:acetolactate synthase-1/2/3 large subunit